jgi:protein-S-isoprenylcysteine O-methyltransferase Ste14
VSFIPAFEIGVWNAWIFVLLMFLIDIGVSWLVIRLFLGSTGSQESYKRHSTTPELSDLEKKIDKFSNVILIVLIGYSIILPLQLDTAWFYIGLSIFILGLIFGFFAMINFALAPSNKPATKGVYTISRNPMYFSMFTIFVSISLACASWVFLLLTIIYFILVDRIVVAEEQSCLEVYGNSYREYMNRTPRWIGIPKIREKEAI